MSIWKQSLVLTLTGIVVPVPAISEEKIELVTELFAPFQVQLEDGSLAGFTVPLVQKILENANMGDVQPEAFPWERTYKQALSKDNTLIFSLMRTDSREDKFKWIGQVAKIASPAVFSSVDYTGPDVSSIEDVRGSTVCGNPSTPPYDYFISNGFVEGEDLVPLSDVLLASTVLGKDPFKSMLIAGQEMLNSRACDFMLIVPDPKGERASADVFRKHFDLEVFEKSLYFAANLEFDDAAFGAIQESYQTLLNSGELYDICSADPTSPTDYCDFLLK